MLPLKPEQLRPLNNRVVVAAFEKMDVTPGGIILPDQAQKKQMRGKVVAVGPGKWNPEGTRRIEVSVKRGDVISFSAYAGHIIIEGTKEMKEIVIMNEDEIMAVIEGC